MHWLCTHGRIMERALFADQWVVLHAERVRMLREGVDCRAYVHNMEQTKRTSLCSVQLDASIVCCFSSLECSFR